MAVCARSAWCAATDLVALLAVSELVPSSGSLVHRRIPCIRFSDRTDPAMAISRPVPAALRTPAISARFTAPSLSRMCPMWTPTVRGEMCSAAPISTFVRPRLTCSATSTAGVDLGRARDVQVDRLAGNERRHAHSQRAVHSRHSDRAVLGEERRIPLTIDDVDLKPATRARSC